MSKDVVTEVFCSIDDFCLVFEPALVKRPPFLEKIFGSLLYADKGYIPKVLATLLFDQGVHLVW